MERREIRKLMTVEEKAQLDALDREYRDICRPENLGKTWTAPWGGKVMDAGEATQHLEQCKAEVYYDAEKRIQSGQ